MGSRKIAIVVALCAMVALIGCGGSARQISIQNKINSSALQSPDKNVLAVLHNQRRSIIETAIAMRGKPYRWGGTSPYLGFDCSGLVHFAYHEAGISVPRMSRYQFSRSTRVPVDRIQAGDLLFFKIGSNPSHVGIYIGESNFIHAPSSGKRVSVSSLENAYWRTRFFAAGHFYTQ